MTFEVGDLVVCVDDRPFAFPVYLPPLVRGRAYTVTALWAYPGQSAAHVMVNGARPVQVPGYRSPSGWSADRFAPLNDNNGDEEALREIVRCFNAPQPTQPERIKA